MFLIILLLLLLLSPSVITSVLAQSSYLGGLPLRVPGDCPSGLVAGQVTFQQSCCGAGQVFITDGVNSFCCPDENQCGPAVLAAPKCADPSWQICGVGLGFCCLQNSVCFTEAASPSNGGCSASGVVLNSLQSWVTAMYWGNGGPGAAAAIPSTNFFDFVTVTTSSLVSGGTAGSSTSTSPSKNSHFAISSTFSSLQTITTQFTTSVGGPVSKAGPMVGSSGESTLGLPPGTKAGVVVASMGVLVAMTAAYISWRQHRLTQKSLQETQYSRVSAGA